MKNPNTDFIPFSRPVMGIEEEQAVLRVLRSGWLTTGPEVKAFEEEFAQFLGVDHALGVNSATSGLHLALEALGIGPGDKVAVPTWTFTATAEVVRYLGGEPVLVDCAPGSFQWSLEHLENLAKKHPLKAVITVHMAGEPSDMEGLNLLRARYGFNVVEDCAHAFPVKTRSGWIGTLGDIGVFSFYANKTMTTGEGGMVVTADSKLAKRMSVMRLHGIDRDAFSRFTSKKVMWAYDVVEPGFKYNLPDLAGAIGRVQLAKAEGFLNQRRTLVKNYLNLLSPLSALELPVWRDDHAWHIFIIRLPEVEGLRDRCIEYLADNQIGTSVHYTPLHRMSYWKNRLDLSASDFPQAEKLFPRVLSLPLYPAMDLKSQQRVTDVLKDFLKENSLV